MWIALFDFCLFLLLTAFFLYGLSAWDRLLCDPEEESGGERTPVRRRRRGSRAPAAAPPGRFWAIWLLVLGSGLLAGVSDLMSWMFG